jgi:O-acetyl-ADP-ribose deacetylase (regulator of RNase III)
MNKITNLTEIEGDLLEFPEGIDIICHVSNCKNAMGSGIAKQIREQYPEAYAADTQAAKNNQNILGYFSGCKITSREFDTPKYIINLYGQENVGIDKRQLDYEGFYSALERLKQALDEKGTQFTLGFPERIGSDRAGGDWNVVKAMILSVFGNQENYKIVIVKFKG